MFYIRHNIAFCANFELKSTGPVHQSSPLVQSSDCRQPFCTSWKESHASM